MNYALRLLDNVVHLTLRKKENAMFAQLITSLKAFVRQPKVRKRLLLALAILFVLQLYFVRALIAAELLFALFFAVILAVVGIVYLLGALGEWSISHLSAFGEWSISRLSAIGEWSITRLGAFGEWSISAGEVGVRVIAQSARRGYATVEEISKKPFHRPHSESAQ
jgi:hypothetical protein